MVSQTIDDYAHGNTVPAIVPSNIVLSSLAKVPQTKEVMEIRRKTAQFLRNELNEYWSINYWFRKSDWYSIEPYPDDTDDTFCALAALFEYDPKMFDGEALAKIVVMLTSCEKKEGGPYDMWLVPEGGRARWNDTDLVVNSNIAYFLHLQDVSLPNVIEFIESKIESGGYEFPYNTIYPAIYFISRFYRGPKLQKMVDLLLSKREKTGRWENPLRTALAISAIINFSGTAYISELQKSIEYLLKSQSPLGSWKASSFYYQMKTKKKTLFAGSKSMTTALCLEALSQYEKYASMKISKKNMERIPIILRSPHASHLTKVIQKKIMKRLSEVGMDDMGEKLLQKIFSADITGTITLLPLLFYECLHEKYRRHVLFSDLSELSVAHIYGWMAYTIYDDFLDGNGDPKQISLANVCLRESYKGFVAVAEKHEARDFVEYVFDMIDRANLWEVTHCRFEQSQKLPDFKSLAVIAEKSFGHCLSTVMLLVTAGMKEGSSEAKHTLSFFKHFIIARQLNDDAHDWEDDMRAGRITPVSVRLLKQHNIIQDKSAMQVFFWDHTIVSVCRDLLAHIEQAEKEINRVSLFQRHEEIIETLLYPLRRSAEKALGERTSTQAFLASYSNNS